MLLKGAEIPHSAETLQSCHQDSSMQQKSRLGEAALCIGAGRRDNQYLDS